MHELGIMYHVVEQVSRVVVENNLSTVEALVLQVGENASVVPRYLEACFPAAVDGTALEKTKLEIEMLPANAICNSCGKVYGLTGHEHACPFCESMDFDVISGKEFLIKEIRGF